MLARSLSPRPAHPRRPLSSMVIPIRAITALLAMLLYAGVSPAIDEAQTPASGAWEYLRQQFYGQREIGVLDESFMSIDVPANTPDPAATPLSVHFGAAAIGRIRQVRVIIDNNPSPVVSTFELAGGARVAEIDLRVRVDRFTSVRAIAETADGNLEMRSSWVNASGGCSAAPSAVAGGQLGEIRFRATSSARSLQIGIRHPNNSGFQVDPVSGDAIAPHFVSHIRLSSEGRTLIDGDTGISLSENPTLRIVSDQPLPVPLTVEVIDSKDGHFSAIWPGPAAAHAAAARPTSATGAHVDP